METDYCSYELSLVLKKAGFDWPCIAQWACEPDGKPILLGSTAFVFSNAELKGRDVTAPHIYHAQKWLRSKGIDIEIRIWIVGNEREYRPYIMPPKCNDFIAYPPEKEYEAALSAGIASAIELIEQEKEWRYDQDNRRSGARLRCKCQCYFGKFLPRRYNGCL